MAVTGAVRSAVRSPARAVPVVLAGLVVALQVPYPLVDGGARNALTVLTVVAFFSATVSHAVVHRGPRWAGAYVVITVGTGLLAESVGTRTGLPFGDYAYSGSLGVKVLSVPVVVPLAWAMMAYPCLLAGQRLTDSRVGAALAGGWALAAWDLFLDPQMVDAGHWTWADVQVALPGEPHVPLSNHLGWLLVAMIMVGVLSLLPQVAADDRQPAGLLLWTWLGSTVAFAVFFGRPVTALVGLLGMGVVLLPWSLRLLAAARGR